MGRVHVEEAALVDLKTNFGTAGEGYKANYTKLTNLISEITSGHIQGDPANELLQKYEEKKEAFEKIYEMINSTQEYVSGRTEQFVSDVDSLMKNMR